MRFLNCSRWKVCFLLVLIFACVFNSAMGEEGTKRKYTLAEKNIQHAKENLPKQIYTQDPKLTR